MKRRDSTAKQGTTFLMKANVFFSSFSGSVRKNPGRADMLASADGATGRTVAPVKMMRNSSAGKAQEENELEWLFRPPKRPEKREKRNGNNVEETRILIGNYYYWVRVSQELPELCRTNRHVSGSVRYEILNHQNFGITDTDLEEIVRYACNPMAHEYRISGRVKRKLQALYSQGKED
jgi:hypothetical protein